MEIIKTHNLQFNNMIDYPNISIAEGSVNFICGESGCGKTSLLKIFNGVVSPSRGQVFFNGDDISEVDPLLLRKEVLLVGQNSFLFDGTIEDNFINFYKYRNLPPPKEKDMVAYLELALISFPIDSRCETLSGGEKQRVFIAIMLSFCPKVLMLDEPTSALDEKNSNKLMENLIAYGKGNQITLIIVSHNKSLAEKYGQQNIFLEVMTNE